MNIRRALRSSAAAGTSATIGLLAFTLPALLAIWMPEVELISVDAPPMEQRAASFVMDLSMVLVPPAEAAPSEEPEPQVAEPPPPAPEEAAPTPEPAAPALAAVEAEEAQEAARVDALAARRITLQDRRQAALLERARRASEAPPRKRKSSACDPSTEGIRQTAEEAFEVEEMIVDTYVKNIKNAQHLAAVYWSYDEAGKIDGFKVKRPKCVLQHAGIQNGDVVESINGKKITNWWQAWRAYNKLKKKDHLRVLVRRKGQLVKLTYDVV